MADLALQENSHLEEEIHALKGKLSESESVISKLKKDLDHVLQAKVRTFRIMRGSCKMFDVA